MTGADATRVDLAAGTDRTSLPPAVREAFDAFDTAVLRWALVRAGVRVPIVGGGGPAGDAEAAASGDIDVLVDAADVSSAEAILETLGWARLPWASGPGGGYIRLDEDLATWPWLDVCPVLRVGTVSIGPRTVAAALRRRRWTRDGWTLDPADEGWGLVLRMLLDPRPPAERHRRRLAAVAAAAAIDEGPFIGALSAPRSPLAPAIPRLRAALASGDLDAVERERPALRSAGPGGGVRRLRRTARSVPKRLAGLLDPRRHGLGIALLGPDGVGKSTTAGALAASLPFDVRLVYMGVSPRHEAGGFRRLPVPGLAAVTGIVQQWARWGRGTLHRLRGRTVVWDRYTEEAWLLPRPGDPLVRRVGRRMRAAVACPPPEVIIILDAPGQVMWERKGEHDPGHLDAERDRYRELAARLAGASLVDATRPADEVLRAILALIWDRQRERLRHED